MPHRSPQAAGQAIGSIPVVCVSYNSAELISDLLHSFRKFYDNPVYIIDGSQQQHYRAIEEVAGRFANVRFIHFDYNIHHGPGMAWAIDHLGLSGRVLFIDSDVLILNHGFLEALDAALQPGMYGVGKVNCVNEGGFDVAYEEGAIKYLHPSCMLCNIEVMRQWPLPARHGAPMTAAMTALHKAGASGLLGHVEWLARDFAPDASDRTFLRHDWQGTVSRTGGYHLEEWQKSVQEAAEFEARLQSLIPGDARRLVEVGCGGGAVARAYRMRNPGCHYTGIETDPADARLAAVFCDTVLDLRVGDIAGHDLSRFQGDDCWILCDVLERLSDPWALLAAIRATIAADGCVIASVPNAQYWMFQAKLACGDFRYEDEGLISKAHLRWFTRGTMLDLFARAGFQIAGGFPLQAYPLENEGIKAAIRLMAGSVGADPELAVNDALPKRYLVKVVPV